MSNLDEGLKYVSLGQGELVNLAHSLRSEFISTNRSGGYMSSTVTLCNTRKYHGMMVLPLDHFGGERHVLLSALDETLQVEGYSFHPALRRYPGVYEPRGHKYLEEFRLSDTPTVVYRVGGITLQKELLFAQNQEHFLVRYTLLESEKGVKLVLRPFLAFRNAHALSKANMEADTRYRPVPNGMCCRMYHGFPTLYMQTNVQSEYVHAPDWHYNVEYTEELARGYPGHEDLYVPGFFEVSLRKGGSVILSVATQERDPKRLSAFFKKELQSRPPRHNFEQVLREAAAQFLADRGRELYVVAGFPWFGRWGRDTLIALPGLTLPYGRVDLFERALTSLTREMRNGLLPNMGAVGGAAFNSVDAPLWLFRAVQEYCTRTGDYARADKLWGKTLRSIFNAFAGVGTPLPFNIRMDAQGLIWAGQAGYALTWMDAMVGGVGVTPRIGYPVEINALWYNAVRFMLELAGVQGRVRFAKRWADLPGRIEGAFRERFYNQEKGYLADYVDAAGQHLEVRPNQIIALSLPYSPLTREQMEGVLGVVQRELYLPFGLRTLSPKNPMYKGHYAGDQPSRDAAYHQGTAWPWLLWPYVEGVRRVMGEARAREVSAEILSAAEREFKRYGLGSLGEVFDGDPPYTPGGTFAQAWSVAALCSIYEFVMGRRGA